MDVQKEFDVPAILGRAHEHELWAAHQAANDRAMWDRVAEKDRAAGDTRGLAVAEKALAALPAITALESLAVAHRLAELLTGRRWLDMQRAREQGASWAEIGAALGMSKQGAADWYRRKIDDQEKYIGGLHDAQRARAALGERGPRITDPASHEYHEAN